MSANHTPGPWILTCGKNYGHEIIGSWNSARTKKPPTVARVAGKQKSKTCAANARLIAAAPDMLEALRSYEVTREAMFAQCLSNPIYDAWGKQIGCTGLNRSHELALAAIAKVEGRP